MRKSIVSEVKLGARTVRVRHMPGFSKERVLEIAQSLVESEGPSVPRGTIYMESVPEEEAPSFVKTPVLEQKPRRKRRTRAEMIADGDG